MKKYFNFILENNTTYNVDDKLLCIKDYSIYYYTYFTEGIIYEIVECDPKHVYIIDDSGDKMMFLNLFVDKYFIKIEPEEEPEFILESYKEEEIKSGFKIGDKVIVTRKAESYENNWDNVWIKLMNNTIGKEGEIIDNDRFNKGFRVKFKTFIAYYPYFVLQKLEEEPEFILE